MSDAYGGLDSRRSNAPCGHFRAELVTCTSADILILSGSPIEYFVHVDYQPGEHEVTGDCNLGVAAVYNHTDVGWVDPLTKLDSVSNDGYTMNWDSTANIDVGDLCEVYYYARYTGSKDQMTGCQVGDVVSTETVDALVQKINDCPSLNFVDAGMVFDMAMGARVDGAPAVGWETYVDYDGAVGTWQTTDLPFYVTGVFVGWNGDSVDADQTNGLYDDFEIRITIDGATARTYNMTQCHRIMMPTGGGGATYDQNFFLNLGLVECESNFIVEMKMGAGAFGPTSCRVLVQGWHL